MDIRTVKVADFTVSVSGVSFIRYIDRSGCFRDFFTDGKPQLSIVEDGSICADAVRADMVKGFEFGFEGIECTFGNSGGEICFCMEETSSGKTMVMIWKPSEPVLRVSEGMFSLVMARFGLWMAFNMLMIPEKCAAVHSSVNVCNGFGVMFLGESGTGKSTHTRLLRERYETMFLLNDDSPFVRVFADGSVRVYGSPWSGKTPCYKQLSYPLKALVRLSQAPHNRMRSLDSLSAIGALLPSVPPAFNYVEETSDLNCDFVSAVVTAVPLYHLECLPDTAAAELSYSTVFGK